MLCLAYGTWIGGIGVMLYGALVLHNLMFLLIYIVLPLLVVVAVFLSTVLLQKLIINPRQNREIAKARQKIESSKAVRIAVVGSYGKTTMKELLVTVLGETKNVVATPGNKNVLISHARWINSKVNGNEDILVFEYGEGQPGDIALLAELSKPTMAVVTGLAPAHLDYYKSVEDIAEDFATIKNYVSEQNIYINGESELLREKIMGQYYDSFGIDGLKAANVQVGFEGTSFDVQVGDKSISVATGLLGVHQVGPLCAVMAVGMQLGVSNEALVSGIAKTTAFEHRMQPRSVGGAWIIDDTYNGNIEGIRAGLDLLVALPAKRRVYVTPGLVDQGDMTEEVHIKMGKLIAKANPDSVVLINKSVTE